MPLRFKAEVDAKEVSDLVKAIAQLDRKMARKILRKAVLVGGRIVRDAAKEKVPVRTGQLRKSIGAKVKSYPRKQIVVAIVGPRKGFRKDVDGVGTVDPINYAHLVEFGRRPVVAGKKTTRGVVSDTGKTVLADGTTFYGKKVKAAAPKPFMRPAWDENEARVREEMVRILLEGLKTAKSK
jgi:HK97 gp10 family phage protein